MTAPKRIARFHSTGVLGRQETWREEARCLGRPERGNDPFYSSDGGTPDWAAAEAICWGCPSKLPCRDDARRTQDKFAFRGGESPEQRRDWLKAHPC